MAAVIGDFGAASLSSSAFCTRAAAAAAGPRPANAAPPPPHHDPYSPQAASQHRPALAPRALADHVQLRADHPRSEHPPDHPRPDHPPAHPHSPPLSASSSFAHKPGDSAVVAAAAAAAAAPGALRVVLTPPEYASPVLAADADATAPTTPQAGDGAAASMAPPDAADDPARVASVTSSSTTTSSSSSSSSSTSTAFSADTVVPTPTAARPPPATNAIPSPASDGEVIVGTAVAANGGPGGSGGEQHMAGTGPAGETAWPSTDPPSSPAPPPRVQKTVLIRDLHHIQALAQRDRAAAERDGGGPGLLGNNDASLQDLKFEISAMPIGDVIEMVAALLTRITTANDREHDALGRPRQVQHPTATTPAEAHGNGDLHSSTPLSASVLAFHGKNVPAITILSYLSRIHKYCPTTYEVFLSLLVYFDRMAQQVNDLVRSQQDELDAARRRAQQQPPPPPGSRRTELTPDETDEALADSDDDDDDEPMADAPAPQPADPAAATAATTTATATPSEPVPPTYFVVDSYNIHRLIIAGVTCASKFFSDVFYTNSRYAKVGGLPLAELNHLELQFLILNDFRLAIPIEDLEAYATMLVEFYAREVVSPRPAAASAA